MKSISVADTLCEKCKAVVIWWHVSVWPILPSLSFSADTYKCFYIYVCKCVCIFLFYKLVDYRQTDDNVFVNIMNFRGTKVEHYLTHTDEFMKYNRWLPVLYMKENVFTNQSDQ